MFYLIPETSTPTTPSVTTGTPVVTTGTPVVTTGTPVVTTGTPFVTKGTPVVTTTTSALTSTTPVIPVVDQARVIVNIKLTSKVFTPELKDKASKAYESLKTKVVQTVMTTY